MAKQATVKKPAVKKQKSFEQNLWDTADKLRGTVESSEYKHVILSLIFLKFISDKFKVRRQALINEGKEQYTDWSQRDDIKAELKVGLILVLAEHGYPPVDRDEVYKEIFEQAENFKKYQSLAQA